MRVEFVKAIVDNYPKTDNQVFLTGDLGYLALEQVQNTFGETFINAGVAEQNMISVAAALAHEGFIPWAYSIAPFITLRPYEQIRNDVCLHNLPVKIVGNGGGFGYGIMGATHHNPEDIGMMRLLPNMKIFIPLLGTDVEQAVEMMLKDPSPNYLRLNLAAKINFPIGPFQTWRKIKDGTKATIIGTGTVLHHLFEHEEMIKDIEIWVVSIFPCGNIPDELLENINKTKKVITIEEHYEAGGLGEMISLKLINRVESKISFNSINVSGYLSGKYGSQVWHLEENSLAGENLLNKIQQFL